MFEKGGGWQKNRYQDDRSHSTQTMKDGNAMVKHFETTTQTGEDVHVTLANNTVIIRFPVEGEEEEWAKTEHRHDWFMRPDIDEQFEDAVIEAVRLPDESREDGERVSTSP